MENPKITDLFKFIHLVNELKHMPRRGWAIRNVKDHESIAGHMYAMAMMTFMLDNDQVVDRLRCLQIALVHDLAESIIGDITPYDNVSEEEKHQMEDEAMKEIASYLGEKMGGHVYELYKEYEAKETAEAKFVKDLDRFDMIFTAGFYEKRDETPGKMQEFFDAVRGKFENQVVRELAEELEKRRS